MNKTLHVIACTSTRSYMHGRPHVHSLKNLGGISVVARALSSTSSMTKLATVTDTGDPMAVPYRSVAYTHTPSVSIGVALLCW